jgi:hypothetical protein
MGHSEGWASSKQSRKNNPSGEFEAEAGWIVGKRAAAKKLNM